MPEATPNAVFVIQIDGAFSVIGAMTFQLEGGALASNIFWIVEGGAATISVGTSGPITFDGDILAATAFTMSASGQTGGSGVLAGTINGCVFTDTGENTLAGETDVNGCLATGSPEPGTAGTGGALVACWASWCGEESAPESRVSDQDRMTGPVHGLRGKPALSDNNGR
jgi:hypothetical protein